MNTRHAEIRAQQRCIPPMVDQLLDLYGQEEHDGHGAVVLYLSKHSIRSMERDMGRRPVARLAEWFDATEQYKRQLYEIDRDAYLAMKRKEVQRQQTAQDAVSGARASGSSL